MAWHHRLTQKKEKRNRSLVLNIYSNSYSLFQLIFSDWGTLTMLIVTSLKVERDVTERCITPGGGGEGADEAVFPIPAVLLRKCVWQEIRNLVQQITGYSIRRFALSFLWRTVTKAFEMKTNFNVQLLTLSKMSVFVDLLYNYSYCVLPTMVRRRSEAGELVELLRRVPWPC